MLSRRTKRGGSLLPSATWRHVLVTSINCQTLNKNLSHAFLIDFQITRSQHQIKMGAIMGVIERPWLRYARVKRVGLDKQRVSTRRGERVLQLDMLHPNRTASPIRTYFTQAEARPLCVVHPNMFHQDKESIRTKGHKAH